MLPAKSKEKHIKVNHKKTHRVRKLFICSVGLFHTSSPNQSEIFFLVLKRILSSVSYSRNALVYNTGNMYMWVGKKKKKRCNISTAFLKIALCQRTGKRLSNIYSPFNTLQYSNAILWSTLKLVPVLQHKALSRYLRPLLSWWPLLQLSVPALLFMRPHIHSFLRFFSYRTSFFLSPSLFFLPSSLTLFFFFLFPPPGALPILTLPSLLSSHLISPLADPFCLIHILSLFVIRSHTMSSPAGVWDLPR